ncbi:cobaltochelatase subunit CobN [Rubellimicrobium sp. CFH 75288]|uniref:cobaltochelatase subunit CobN n=1 Tax=Rubellimicrobium sp. CFH 75288 TaxID=2697034 RepID=UPI0014131BA3|nr:cobaltochelatase subunit CobN [Rubellimicrobium sp. CFH 75288]NAZ37617.1 cobaltochelatase subunit CobN [Rubellimicrobium sp. CFH 75288]
MHLLAATPGTLDDGARPVDPGQTPADLVVLSAADTELALLAAAREALGEEAPGLRLWSLANLAHPLSVDLHLEACASRSRLVVVRLLGGANYWRYGLSQYSARLHEAGVPLVVLPGDDKPDAELRALSTVGDEDYAALWAFLVEGGAENAAGFLRHARAMLDGTPRPPPARPLLRAGVWWPGEGVLDPALLRARWTGGAPVVPVVFYRALLLSGATAPVAHLVRALLRRGLNPLPVFVASLKDPLSADTLRALMGAAPPSVILNATAFAAGGENPLAMPEANGAPVLQVVLAGSTEAQWEEGTRGLSAADIAMNVALPEMDGRVLARAVSFKDEARFDAATQCPIVTHVPRGDRVAFVGDLAAAWARLRATPAAERRVALVLANYPDRDGRLANGVGLDTPASTVAALRLMAGAGYRVEGAPEDADALMARLLAGPTNAPGPREGGERLPLGAYRAWFDALPWEVKRQVADRWGAPEDDPAVRDGAFVLGLHRMGHVVVGLQPARGYGVDPRATYHAPDLVPPHGYLAFYLWLRAEWGAHAIVHMGKHGNLEWLPGKGVALSAACWPEVALGPLPHLYPFIVNDPGEGTQAKRRAQAVILDHLTPPLTRAETYGPLRDLEGLLDELASAEATDSRRAAHLRREIATLAESTGIAADAGLADGRDLAKLDAWICDLKEAQIRDGLHVFGASPGGVQRRDLLLALARVPRGDRASLPRALAADLGLPLDPLAADWAAPWEGPRPDGLAGLSPDPWRTQGDTVERLELFAQALLEGRAEAPGPASAAVLAEIRDDLGPRLDASGPAEGAALLAALDGRAVAPGPSGAPTRGRPDVLPTGRNFFSVDGRAMPTRAAWTLGRASAEALVERHAAETGDWPRALVLTAWGTSAMRTGGDDVAQGLALMGVRPVWEAISGRVTGIEVVPLAQLGRPRVDVTLRISGFFRDAFPQLVALFDSAARAIQALEEPEEMNAAPRAPGPRVYGSKPGAYGAGLQALIDGRAWEGRADLARAYLDWGGWAYGAHREGVADHAGFAERLRRAEAVVQNQDNREHDLLDSDDYYQFEGGAAAAVEWLRGEAVPVWHGDHSRPERPVIRSLEEEVARVVRSRVVNPKWIAGVMRHGYKGAFEIAASVDYLFAFAATTNAVRGHHFDAVEEAVLGDEAVRAFLAAHNAPALREIAERLHEAIARGLWTPRSNSARARIDALRETREGS